MTAPTAPKATLTARLDERFVAPIRNASFARRTWFSVTLIATVLLHALLIAFLLWRDHDDPDRLAQLQETPVEVVVEQPPPPPAPPKQEAPQPQAQKQMDEKPATSAPRAPNEEPERKEAEDKETKAPKAPGKTAAAPPQQAEPQPEKVEAESKPDTQKETDPKEAEALDKATPPEPPKKPASLVQAKPKPRPKTPLEQLAGAADTPDYAFAKPMRKRAKVVGGSEDNRYLAVIYGMIAQTGRIIEVPDVEWSLTVAFQIDGHGNLVAVGVTHSSGFRQVDMAAVEAIQAAAPFPPPPSGSLTGLVAKLHSANHREDAMAAGER